VLVGGRGEGTGTAGSKSLATANVCVCVCLGWGVKGKVCKGSKNRIALEHELLIASK
jgi:hypothetical protein